MYYNFARVHETLRYSPAMEASVSKKLWGVEDIGNLLEEAESLKLASFVFQSKILSEVRTGILQLAFSAKLPRTKATNKLQISFGLRSKAEKLNSIIFQLTGR